MRTPEWRRVWTNVSTLVGTVFLNVAKNILPRNVPVRTCIKLWIIILLSWFSVSCGVTCAWYRGYAEKKREKKTLNAASRFIQIWRERWKKSGKSHPSVQLLSRSRGVGELDEATRFASEGVYRRRKHQGRVGNTSQLRRVLLQTLPYFDDCTIRVRGCLIVCVVKSYY